ncbi:sensor histidine kinase [Geobacillus thermodenitrificans]|uniref:sensor histidine kinase n=1 Tax=Geobacillus thermodenitrificans TaxID=33940 RepID=UPI003D1CA0D0
MTRKQIETSILNDITHLHQENLDKQAARINEQLNSLEKQLQLVQIAASFLFTAPYRPYNDFDDYILKLTKEEEGYYWEPVDEDVSNAGATARTTLTPEVRERLAISKSLEPIFQQIVQQNDQVAAIYYIGPQSYWRIYPKMNVKQEIEHGYLLPDEDLTTKNFFLLAAQSSTNQPVWTGRYVDLTHRQEMFSLSTPIYDRQGRFVGVIGMDITISQALEHLLNVTFHEPSAYALLIGKDGKVIAYQPKAKRDLPFLALHLHEVAQTNKAVSLSIRGQDRIVLRSAIPTTGWSLVSIIPKKEIVDPIKQITSDKLADYKTSFSFQFIVLLCSVGVILLVSSFFIWNHFTNPIKQLTDGLSSVSAGDFQPKIPISSLREFQMLHSSFNDMAQKLDKLIRSYEQLHRELEQKVEERTFQLAKVNESLRQTNDKLQQLEQTRREMFENIAHDLKTPITLILGYIDAILDGIVDRAKSHEYLGRMKKHLHAINHLVKGIYELSCIENQKGIFQFEWVDANCFFVHMQDIYKHWGHLSFRIPEHLPAIYIDVKYMERALYNLIDNAEKYSEAGSPIEVAVEYTDAHLMITVRDYGWGISKEDLPHIFNRFYRVDKARNSDIPGNGLGLAIVKEIVQAHGGTIEVKSQRGKGTSFTLFLPIQPNEGDIS